MLSVSVYDIFHRNAVSRKNEPALIDKDQTISFSDLLGRSHATAGVLGDLGLKKGDRLAVLAYNSCQYVYLFGAASVLGVILVPLNWRLSIEELGHIVSDAGCAVLATDASFSDQARKIKAEAACVQTILGMDEPVDNGPCLDPSAVSDTPGPAPLKTDDPYCLIYTAAMGGKPRGATLTHGNIVFANVQTMAAWTLTPADAYLNMLPLFHISGINLAFAAMHAGGRNIILERFDAKKAVEWITRQNITLLGSFPPILTNLADTIDETRTDATCLRHVLGLDAPDTIARFEKMTGADFWTLYGQTETTGQIFFSPSSQKPGSAGQLGVLSRARVADELDKEVAAGQTGEILVQGPLVFAGYWNMPDENRHTFRNGWHHTGDLGRMDQDGYLWFKGRKPEKELIKPGGENVYPAEVEAAVLEHPSVDAVCVIGVPDPKFGEGIKAVCVLKDGTELAGEDLSEFVARRIARYKKPRYVAFVDRLPETEDGRVDRAAVKEQHGDQ